MSEQNEEPQGFTPSKVIAKFKSASTKGGQAGYELTVTDAASAGDVDATVANAIEGRRRMVEALTDDFGALE